MNLTRHATPANIEHFVKLTGDLIASHHVFESIRESDDERTVRLISMAGLGGLGYIFGPSIYERVTRIGNINTQDPSHQRFIASVGGALMGGLAGYHIGKHIANDKLENAVRALPPITVPKELENAVFTQPPMPDDDSSRRFSPWLLLSGLYFTGRILSSKGPEQRSRLAFGLAGSALGYFVGPEALAHLNIGMPREMLEKVKSYYADTSSMLRAYEYTGAIVGAVGGGTLGWYKGPDIAELFVRKGLPAAHDKLEVSNSQNEGRA